MLGVEGWDSNISSVHCQIALKVGDNQPLWRLHPAESPESSFEERQAWTISHYVGLGFIKRMKTEENCYLWG